MRANEFLNEGRNHPVIVVDVQPEYCGINDGDDAANRSDVLSSLLLIH